MTGQLIQFGGSLLAIVLLALLARQLRLGTANRIRDADHARALAGEAADGFTAEHVAVDAEGRAALLTTQDGRIMLLKMHGARTSARLLDTQATARIRADLGKHTLEVDSGDRWFRPVILVIDLADDWAKAINRL